ncbi:hypothetical protein BZA05DRAFT_412934 [Tricharina praecox]|uniref:uncharacterized protein n=1 Tax=Tricharina praecox TaxID=43433 RepID=UPI00221ECA80|nr:uncharacterized protein BZA05DRAFT_412934 [Tricharina praecox]KAI5841684.1 hypothetical protein BZA05DRAFT_412934 [Tricharina praecox]
MSSSSRSTNANTYTRTFGLPPAERYAAKLHSFIKRENKSGLRILIPEAKVPKFGRYGGKGAEMVENLVAASCTRELAEQFAVLVLYDLVILVDDSSSMEYGQDQERRAALSNVLTAVAKVYELARDEGIVAVRFLNTQVVEKDIRSADVAEVLEYLEYNGVTMIGTQLQEKVLRPFVEYPRIPMTKPVLTIVITEGSIEGEKDGLLRRTISDCHARLKADRNKTVDAAAFMFARLGTDPGARKLLEDLDNDKNLSRWIDCLPVDSRLEAICSQGTARWGVLRKLMLGALYESIDKMDEDSEIEDTLLPFKPDKSRFNGESPDSFSSGSDEDESDDDEER